MSQQKPNPAVSAQPSQENQPARDDKAPGVDSPASSGCSAADGERKIEVSTPAVGGGSVSQAKKGEDHSRVLSAVNPTPSISTAPVASGANCYFQTRDFLSEEAKQAAANLRDTRAAIADKRSMFFSECPKSPKHPLDVAPVIRTAPGPSQRSSMFAEGRDEGPKSKDDRGLEGSVLIRDRPRLAPERTMSGFYFSNPSSSGLVSASEAPDRASLKTFHLMKNCPPLELYMSAPVPPREDRPEVCSPPPQVTPALSLARTEPAVDPGVASGERLPICPLADISETKVEEVGNGTMAPEEKERSEQSNGDLVPGKVAGEKPSEKSTETRVGKSHEVRFFSAPDASQAQETDGRSKAPQRRKSGKGFLAAFSKRRHSGDESQHSTPNSGSQTTSVKTPSGLNKFKAFFTDVGNSKNSSSSSSSDKHGSENSSESNSGDGTKLPSANSKPERGSFKLKKSSSNKQQLLPITVGHGSPGGKSKKSSTDKDSQKSSWKGKVVRTIKRYGSGSVLLSTESAYYSAFLSSSIPEGPNGVFGVPLEVCEASTTVENVPLFVVACVNVVEERGMDNQGIYRVPGNTGAIKELQDEINRDPKGLCLDNERWQDVNLVSSLLKLFFRKLPDPLITDRLYEPMVNTSRLERSEKRMLKLKKILHDMPERNFNTFAFLSKHLGRVAKHEEKNKMDAHNLAIMFGPTLIRPKDNSMPVMAKNMSDQCKIIETIISHCDWFFASWDEDVNVPLDVEIPTLNTPAIDARMVAKAQSLGIAGQKSSSSSSLHLLPYAMSAAAPIPLSSSTSSVPSLALHFPGWKVEGPSEDPFSPMAKKGFFSRMGNWGRSRQPQSFKFSAASDSSECEISSSSSPALHPPRSLESLLVGPVPSEDEPEVKVVRHGKYRVDRQCFQLADNREPARLPWHLVLESNSAAAKREDGDEDCCLFRSGP